MYLSYCPYWYALDSMLEECLFSTEHSRKRSWMLGGGVMHFASTSHQQRSPVCTGCTGQRKTSQNQVPEDCFFSSELLRDTLWINKRDVRLSSRWMKSLSKSAFQYWVERRRKGKAVLGGSQHFTVNMKFCCQLTQICSRAITYPPAEVRQGVSGREALIIFLDLKSEKLFYSEWVIMGAALRMLWISQCDVVSVVHHREGSFWA